ncbi:hypothetical protein ABIE33_003200 [Ensifer sp. 4252]
MVDKARAKYGAHRHQPGNSNVQLSAEDQLMSEQLGPLTQSVLSRYYAIAFLQRPC